MAAMSIMKYNSDSSEEEDEDDACSARYQMCIGRDCLSTDRWEMCVVRSVPEPAKAKEEEKSSIEKTTEKSYAPHQEDSLEVLYFDFKNNDPHGFNEHPEW